MCASRSRRIRLPEWAKPQPQEKAGERTLTDDELTAVWHALDTCPVDPHTRPGREAVRCDWRPACHSGSHRRVGARRHRQGDMGSPAPPDQKRTSGGNSLAGDCAGNPPGVAPGHRQRGIPFPQATSRRSRPEHIHCSNPAPTQSPGRRGSHPGGPRSDLLPVYTQGFAPNLQDLAGKIGLSKEIRDRIQGHALHDVSSKHYDRYDYFREKREALSRWDRHLRRLISGNAHGAKVVSLQA